MLQTRAPALSITAFFFFNDTATTEIYTLSLHDALPIFPAHVRRDPRRAGRRGGARDGRGGVARRARRRVRVRAARMEEHTAELPSRQNFLFRLLFEKKKTSSPLRRIRAIA